MLAKNTCIFRAVNTPERIRQLLLDSGIPEKQVKGELARVCGISVQAVYQWFDGSTGRISPEYLSLIASEWGTTTDYLITGKGPRYAIMDKTEGVDLFRSLSPENREVALKMMRGLLETQKAK